MLLVKQFKWGSWFEIIKNGERVHTFKPSALYPAFKRTAARSYHDALKGRFDAPPNSGDGDAD